MRHKKVVITVVTLFFILFCCACVSAETYDFGGATDNGVYSGTLAVDNSGNVAFTVAAATGPGADVQVTAQYSDDAGGAAAGQETRAVGDSAFIGSGAASSNGDTASTGAHAIGDADIDTLQAAQAGQGGVPGFATVDGTLAIQDTRILGQTTAAGSLGVSHAGYEAHTNTHTNGFGAIDTFQGAGAGDVNLLGIGVIGAVAAQESAIASINGGSASSTATGGGNTAETQLSLQGTSMTLQGAAAGQVDVPGFATVDGAVAGQHSLIIFGVGSARSAASNDNGCQANTELETSGLSFVETTQFAGSGEISGTLLSNSLDASGAIAGQSSNVDVVSLNGYGTATSTATNNNGYEAATRAHFDGAGRLEGVQVAAAGNLDGTLFSTPFNGGGAVAGQIMELNSANGGYAVSIANTGNSYQAYSYSEYGGNGDIDTMQGAAAAEIGVPGMASVDGVVAGQISDITSDEAGVVITVAGNTDYETGARSTAGFFVGTGGVGTLSAIEGAASGMVDIPGFASVDGAVAGQSVYVDPPGCTGNGYAATIATTGSGYDYVFIETTSTSGNSIGTVADYTFQGAAAGIISVPGAFAEGAIAYQNDDSSPAVNNMRAIARHGTSESIDNTNPFMRQYAVAGRATGFGEGAITGHF